MVHAAKERRKCLRNKRNISQRYVIDEYRYMNKFAKQSVINDFSTALHWMHMSEWIFSHGTQHMLWNTNVGFEYSRVFQHFYHSIQLDQGVAITWMLLWLSVH